MSSESKSSKMEQHWDSILSGIAEIKPGGTQALKQILDSAHREGKKLRVKLGIDPTSADLHLGHMVCIQKLKQFQEAGHIPVLIIGAYTAQVGDPSGRNEARPPLTAEQVRAHAATYLDQVSKILDLSKVELLNNADWFNKFSMEDLIRLAAKATVNQMVAKEAFGKRLDDGYPLYIHEILYPLLQGYDSVQVRADIELGGTDQTFNLLAGRDLQKIYGQTPQLAVTMPLLIGLDGKKKMSKTSHNYIALNDSPNEMFGKVMSIPDNLILDYFSLAGRASAEELRQVGERLKTENPRDIKAELGRKIVSIYYSTEEALSAEEAFTKQFRQKEIPDDIQEYLLQQETELATLMLESGLCPSKQEAKRLVAGGGVKLDGEKISDAFVKIKLQSGNSKVLQVGKRKFIKLVTH
jgi:tyrosyl-tRNA synthetase